MVFRLTFALMMLLLAVVTLAACSESPSANR